MEIFRRRTVLSGIRALIVVLLLPFTLRGREPQVPPPARLPAEGTSMNVPQNFEENRGQFPEGHFVKRSPGFTLVLEPNLVTMKLRGAGIDQSPAMVRMALSGGNATRLAGVDEVSGVKHYLGTSDPKSWVTDVRSYARVRYEEVYPGIDLVFREAGDQIEYDFVLAPGADPDRIRLAFSGIERASVDANGDLVLDTAGGSVRQRRPHLYQDIGGARREVAGDFVLRENHEVGFSVGRYDAGHPLIIDPVLVYSTLFGGSRGRQGIQDVTTDASGNAYVVGYFPQDGDRGPADIVVAKFGPGGRFLFATTFGGNFTEAAGGLALDSAGNIYVTGSTQFFIVGPPPFPTTPNAFQPASGGGVDAFLTKLDPTGSAILYSTFLGGAGTDIGADIGIDAEGRIYIAGTTNSANFPTAVPWQADLGGAADAFVTVFNPTATGLVFSTYLGGSGEENVARLALCDTAVIIAGTTSSSDFPTRAPLQSDFGGGTSDAFLAQLSSVGALMTSTYFGGSGDEQAFGVTVDGEDSAYLTGNTNSADFPTLNALQPALSFPPEADAFLAKIALNTSSLVYSTYLEIGTDAQCLGLFPNAPCGAVVIDDVGNAYVTAGSPLSRGIFVTKVDAAGARRLYSYTGFGGHAITLSSHATPDTREIIVVGRTRDFLFPVLRAFDPFRSFFEDEEGWVMKLTDGPNPIATFEENDPRIAYTGTWEVHVAESHSRGAALRSAEAGASATITFTGTGIQVIGRRDPSAGFMKITRSFDPFPVGLDSYASPAEPRSLLISVSNLPLGTYTLILEVAGTHNNRSSGDFIWIDGINVIGIDPSSSASVSSSGRGLREASREGLE